MIFQTDGIVIREQPLKEKDKLLTLLTRSHGVIRAFANGARVPKNKLAAGANLFCYSDLSVQLSDKGVFTLREASVKAVFFDLRQDIVMLTLAQYFAELSSCLAPREEDASEFLRLLLNALALICQKKKPLSLIKSVTELRMLSMSGYMPSLLACDNCCTYLTPEMYFTAEDGHIYCENCRPQKQHLTVHGDVVTAMRHICFVPLDNAFSFRMRAPLLKELADVCEAYVRKMVPVRLKTLDSYLDLETLGGSLNE